MVRRLVARVLAVAALAMVGVMVMGLGSAGGRGTVAPATAGTDTPPAVTSPTRPWSLPAGRPAGAVLIGRVTSPLRTAAGVVMPTTALGNRTWLLILSHHGRHGVALVPTGGDPVPAAVDLSRLRLRWTSVRLDVDLSLLRLFVHRGSRLLGEFPIAAGMAQTPTPTGRFSVTDRVVFPDSGTYGTFALGLSAHQTHLLPGWSGGDQVAIHGTPHSGSIGSYASLGCIRVTEAALRVLRRAVPLGAPVTIRP
jgi:lipoprotein-anchoring transpeptidase ErfK/SrfK